MSGDRPNVLLIILDSLRSANAGICGYHRDTTPFLNELASEAVVFEEARAGAQWSLPSHASLFTGLHVEQHQLYDVDRRIKSGHTVFDTLLARGYATGVFSSNDYITGDVRTGLEDSFETVQGRLDPPFPDALDPMEYDSTGQFLRDCLGHAPLRSVLNGALVKLGWDAPEVVPDRLLRFTCAGYPHDDVYADLFLDWVRHRDQPWAACLNLMGTHHPYRANNGDPWFSRRASALQEQFRSRWEFYCGHRPWSELEATTDLYDCVIRNADALVERVINTLRAMNEYENTMAVITADHGDGFGERSQLYPDIRIAGHKIGAHEALLHVPLIVKYPGQSSSRRVKKISSLSNFTDAVLSVLDGTPEPGSAFPVERFALASTHGVNTIAASGCREYCVESQLDTLDRSIRVAYEQQDGSIIKELSDGNRSVKVNLDSGKSTESDGSLVSSAFENIKSADVVVEEEQSIDEATKSHLEELGYR